MQQSKFQIEKIAAHHSNDIKELIFNVMPEFGAKGPGFAIEDPEVENMYLQYSNPGHIYYVVVLNGKVMGGGGVGPLIDGPRDTCELKKMYFYPELRGLGAGKTLLERCLQQGKELGYKKMYLETLDGMDRANRLYQKLGFKLLSKPMGNTGHFGCNTWYLKDLN